MDLSPCQVTNSELNGARAYARALLAGLWSQRGSYEMMAMVEKDWPWTGRWPGLRWLRRPPFHHLCPPPNSAPSPGQDVLMGLAYNKFISPWRFDIVHNFALGEEKQALFSHDLKSPGQIVSATLGDFSHWLDSLEFSADYSQCYLSMMNWLKGCDLLLTSSVGVSKLAEDVLGLASWRLVAVPPALPPDQGKESPSPPEIKAIRNRYGLNSGYILGLAAPGRLETMLSAFAGLPSELRSTNRLVLWGVRSEARSMVKWRGRGAGLRDEDIVFLDDPDSWNRSALLQGCSAFIMASTYEGFGLPALEAMSYGAPVLVADREGLTEIMDHPAARFRAGSSDDLTVALYRILSDKALAENIGAHGRKRAGDFTCERSGRVAWEAFNEALNRQRKAGVKYARSGWLPRRRLAYLFPLPENRPDLKKYAEEVGPWLNHFFEADIYTDWPEGEKPPAWLQPCQVYRLNDFDSAAFNYETIIYNLADTAEHGPLLELLAKWPGVVVLHDVYLKRALKNFLPVENLWISEMFYAHGPRFRRWLLAESGAMRPELLKLPGSKRVLDQALGVVTPSSFVAEACRIHYPEGINASIRLIPGKNVSEPSAELLKSLREKYKLAANDLVIMALGPIGPASLSGLLLEAFRASEVSSKGVLFLADYFVGGSEQTTLRCLPEAKEPDGRIRLMAPVDDDDLQELMSLTDVVVHLRPDHSGGLTPGAAMDALAWGRPLIVNYHGGFKELPEAVVWKLAARPSPEDLTQALNLLGADENRRQQLGRAGRDYLFQRLHPRERVARLAAATHDFYKRRLQQYEDLKGLEGLPAADRLQATDALQAYGQTFSKPSFDRARIFLYLGRTASSTVETGIPRVSKNIVRNLYTLDRPGFEPVAFDFEDGRMVSPYKWLKEHGCLTDTEPTEPLMEFRPGDYILMIDPYISREEDMAPLFQSARQTGCQVISVVYDIIALTHPHTVPDSSIDAYFKWVPFVAEQSDAVIGISQAGIEEFGDWVRKNEPSQYPRLHLTHWTLGCSELAEQLKVCPKSEPYMLMVGSIEPRKNHDLAIDALKILRQRGIPLKLCVAGRNTWMSKSLFDRLKGGQEPGVELCYNLSDHDLAGLYAGAKALLFPSQTEGFGLPLVEAAQYGTPIICSDIPVFREICGPHASYVNISSASSLAAGLEDWLRLAQAGQSPDSSLIKYLTWEDSAIHLLTAVLNTGRCS